MSTMARVNIDLPDELHRDAKVAAALKDVTLKDFITVAIEAALDDLGVAGTPNFTTFSGVKRKDSLLQKRLEEVRRSRGDD